MVAIYLDGADLETMARLEPHVEGFTTNPSLMKKAGITRYRDFAREVLAITKKPVSFEVLSDHGDEAVRQAREIASWGSNVYVKMPVDMHGRLKELWSQGIKLNITAVMDPSQIRALAGGHVLSHRVPAIVSIFAGRIADTGRDPCGVIASKDAFGKRVRTKIIQILWASCREVYNITQAEQCGADIITVSPAIFEKYHALKGKDLLEYSDETVAEFTNDAKGIEL